MKEETIFYKELSPFVTCMDHTVSKQEFDLGFNADYEMLVTQPVPEDLAPYYQSDAYISHTNAKKTWMDRVYQLVRSYTLSRKVALLNSFALSGKSILDVGAGTGHFLEACKKQAWEIFGVEPNEDARKVAAKKNISLAAELDVHEGKKFDVITLWHVLEHVPNLTSYLKRLKRLLKKDGVLVIAVPNFQSYDAGHYKQFWAAYDVPRHLWHFSQNSIKKLAEEQDMFVDKSLPMKFDAYYVSLLSEQYQTQKKNPFRAFRIAWRSNRKAKTNNQYSSLIYLLKKK